MTTTELTGAESVAWDLSDLYESGDDPRLEADVQETEQASAAFRERYHGKVAELDAAGLAEAIEERERIESIFTRAIYYAHLWFATDMADAPRGALLARLTETGARRSRHSSLLRARARRARRRRRREAPGGRGARALGALAPLRAEVPPVPARAGGGRSSPRSRCRA